MGSIRERASQGSALVLRKAVRRLVRELPGGQEEGSQVERTPDRNDHRDGDVMAFGRGLRSSEGWAPRYRSAPFARARRSRSSRGDRPPGVRGMRESGRDGTAGGNFHYSL